MIIKIKIYILIMIFTLFILILPVAAANMIAVNGTAEIINTGGSFFFDTNNSNVTVDSTTGDITGFVWSDDLGWIDFDNNGDTGGASVNLTTGKISGLAYVVNSDGFIDFTNFNSNATVNLSSGGITGYAWSNDVGWIDFSSARVAGTLLQLVRTGASIIGVFALSAGLLVVATVRGRQLYKKISKKN
jgi:hypothetical protein